MQDSLKSNSPLRKVLALFLALLIVVTIPLQSVSALTIDGVARIVEIGRLIYEVARLGWDGYELYKDIESETDFYTKEEALINGMSRSDVVGSMSVKGFSCTDCTNYTYSCVYLLRPLFTSSPSNAIDLLQYLGVNNRVCVLGCNSYELYGFFWDESGCFSIGRFINPTNVTSPLVMGVYSLSDLVMSEYANICFNSGTYYHPMYYSESYARSSPNFSSKDVSYIDFSGDPWYDSSLIAFPCYLSFASSLDFKLVDAVPYSFYNSFTFGSARYCSNISWDNSRIVVAAPEAEPETRPSSLMQAIHNYNVDNSYTDNSTTVNYFLAPKDQTPTSDNVVSPAIFDEETWIFTEPATGAQYQSTGWTYDYNTRTYDIDLEVGTFTLDGTDVTRIVSQYGNELATITYYDASGNVLATDEYNYVMMAASECALNGHTYNANTTKEPTCTGSGERTYTCSVCGDQYVEEISKTDHVYADHTITQEPTCTVGGISSKTCSTCGDQITEKLDPLGHDFIAKEITETTYELPPGTSCPSCSGTNYTFSRQGVIYTLLCSECNTEWTAEADVTYGSTTYLCSRCGESKVEGDSTEETQETWFTKFIYKFKWLSSIGQIYRQLVADITSDAETAAAIADGTVTLDEVTSGHAEFGGGSAGSEGSGRHYTAPELAISFGDSDHYGVDWDAIKPLNLSWYAPHKETVDGIVSGILWLGFLFLLIKRAPGIIQGAEMITEDRMKIDLYNTFYRRR